MVNVLVQVFAFLTGIVGVLMSFGHFFQAWRIFKRKSADDVSFIFYGLMCGGTIIWLVYGLLIVNWPIILGFGVGVLGTALVLFLMLRYRVFNKGFVRRSRRK